MTTVLPSTLGRWARDRAGVLATIGLGMVTWPIAVAAGWVLWPATTRGAAPADRIAYALQLATAPAFLVLLMVAACFRIFDTVTAEDPRAGAESVRFKTNQRVLSNTIEQSWIFVPLLLALATRLAPAHMKILPIAVASWCAGRVMFWIGYHVAPRWRGPGFDWTFNTSVLLAGWFVYTLFR